MRRMTLHGRAAERNALREACQPGDVPSPRLVVLYGRRRVGKTFLLQHVRAEIVESGTVCAYAAATRESGAAQRVRLADAVAAAGCRRPSDGSWHAFWRDVATEARQRPVNLFIDEVPYLIESDGAWASILQSAWDEIRHSDETLQLTIVLTGSAISTMTQLVSSRGALFERPDQLIRLDPFDLPTATTFLRTESAVAAVEAYTASDGYPLLLQRWDPAASALDNLHRLAADPMGALATNATTLLLDLGDSDATQRVLGAIGRGAHTLREINTRAGQRTERPLAVLEHSGLVERNYPAGDASPKSALLRIGDNYLRLWFAIVEPNLQLIDGGQGVAVINGQTKTWEHLVAQVFEREARQHAYRLLAGTGRVVEWWTSRPEQAQIDVVGVVGNSWVVVGEAKWKDTFTLGDYRQFQRHLRVAGDRADRAGVAVWSQRVLSTEVAAQNPTLRHYSAAQVCGLTPSSW